MYSRPAGNPCKKAPGGTVPWHLAAQERRRFCYSVYRSTCSRGLWGSVYPCEIRAKCKQLDRLILTPLSPVKNWRALGACKRVRFQLLNELIFTWNYSRERSCEIVYNYESDVLILVSSYDKVTYYTVYDGSCSGGGGIEKNMDRFFFFFSFSEYVVVLLFSLSLSAISIHLSQDQPWLNPKLCSDKQWSYYF